MNEKIVDAIFRYVLSEERTLEYLNNILSDEYIAPELKKNVQEEINISKEVIDIFRKNIDIIRNLRGDFVYKVLAIQSEQEKFQKLIGTNMEFLKYGNVVYLLFDNETYIKTKTIDFFKDHDGQYKLLTDVGEFVLGGQYE